MQVTRVPEEGCLGMTIFTNEMTAGKMSPCSGSPALFSLPIHQ